MTARARRAAEGLLRALDHPRAPWIILIVGLILRAGMLTILRPVALDGDALSYHKTAKALALGTTFDPDWPPGLPAYIALVYSVFHVKMFFARLAMIPVYLGFSAALFALTRRLSGRPAATLALALFAVCPAGIWNAVTPLTQLPAAALTIAVVYLADRCFSEERIGLRSALFGAALAALILTRPSNLLLAALPLYLAYKARRWQVFAIPTLIVGLSIGGWSAYVRRMTGYTVLINNANSQNVYYGNNPWTPLYRTWWFGSHKDPGDPTVPPGFLADFDRILAQPVADRDKLFTKAAAQHIKEHPELFALRTVNRVRTFFGFDTYTSAQIAKVSRKGSMVVLLVDVVCYLLMMVPLLLAPAAWPRLREAIAREPDHPHPLEIVRIFAVVLLLAAAPYFVTFSHPTFHLPFVALALAMSAGVLVLALRDGLRSIWDPLSSRGRMGLAFALLAFLAVQIEWAAHVASRAQ